MYFPPPLNRPVLILGKTGASIHITPGVTSGYGVHLNAEGVEESVIYVTLADGREVTRQPANVIENDPTYGFLGLDRMVQELLSRDAELAPSPVEPACDSMPF